MGPEPEKPSSNILSAIQNIAPYVARMGPLFEALAISKNSSSSDYTFLTGGEGKEYYKWTVRKLKMALKDQTGLVIGQRAKPLTANERGVLLGEDDLQGHNALPSEGFETSLQNPKKGIAGNAQCLKKAYKKADKIFDLWLIS